VTKKGYYGFASRAAYEAYYSGPLPKWETDAMAAYAREAEQERAMMSEHREDPSQIEQRPPAPAPMITREQIEARLKALDQYQFALTSSMPDEGELTDRELLRVMEVRSQLQALLQDKGPVRAVTGTGQVKGK